MKQAAVFVAVFAAVAVLAGSLANAAPLPLKIGKCSLTRVAHIGTRLEDPAHPNSRPNAELGTSIDFINGGHQVSYDYVTAIARARLGDLVKVCLVSIPAQCPPGDVRGRFYKTRDLRTHGSWTLPDAQHSCGGA